MRDVTPVVPAHTKESARPPLTKSERRWRLAEWNGAVFGVMCALEAAADGMDLAALRTEFLAWHAKYVNGSGLYRISDWPGWETLGIGRRPTPLADPPKKSTRPPRPPRPTFLDLLSDPATPKGQWVVYRHFDRHGFLLYVGITSDLTARQHQHRSNALWWTEIERITVEPAADYESARALELVAIATEDPEWNTANRA